MSKASSSLLRNIRSFLGDTKSDNNDHKRVSTYPLKKVSVCYNLPSKFPLLRLSQPVKTTRRHFPPFHVNALSSANETLVEESERTADNGAAFTEEESLSRVSAAMGITQKIVGVLGGGQLGRMLCEAAAPLGIRVRVLDAEDAPAGKLADEHVTGSFKDPEAVRKFAQGCDVLTVEIEHVDAETLDEISLAGIVDVEPKPITIKIIQDKFVQKEHFRRAGIPLPDFQLLESIDDALSLGDQWGYPLMLKSRRNAYDGRGNAVARGVEQVENAIACLGGIEHGLYAERWAPFTKELAVMVVRSRDGSVVSYPVVETTHKDNICHTVLCPAEIDGETEREAKRVAEKAIASLEGAGVFGVELFLLEDGTVLLNEVAPRPHNSAHHTIEACYTSQFENHLRAILDLPLGDTGIRGGNGERAGEKAGAVMYNILGEEDGDAGLEIAHGIMRRALEVPGASIHWYNKSEMKKGRKMGHVTVFSPSLSESRRRMALITGARYDRGEAERKDEKEREAQAGGNTPLVAIIMGSDSDLPVMRQAAEILETFRVPYELTVVSAHRTPVRMFEFARSFAQRGGKVIIAGAGGAAHLPGMVASLSPLPVIGVPVKASVLEGLDSLLSIVQMPRGIPVATVAINNSANAGLLAVRILGASDPILLEKMAEYQRGLEDMVLEKVQKLEEVGWKKYLDDM